MTETVVMATQTDEPIVIKNESEKTSHADKVTEIIPDTEEWVTKDQKPEKAGVNIIDLKSENAVSNGPIEQLEEIAKENESKEVESDKTSENNVPENLFPLQ